MGFIETWPPGFPPPRWRDRDSDQNLPSRGARSIATATATPFAAWTTTTAPAKPTAATTDAAALLTGLIVMAAVLVVAALAGLLHRLFHRRRRAGNEIVVRAVRIIDP